MNKQARQELSRPRRTAALTILHTQPRADTMRQLGSDCVKSCKQETCRRTCRFVIGPPKASEYSRTMQPEVLKIHTLTCRHVYTYSNFHVLLCQVCACMCVSMACAPGQVQCVRVVGRLWEGGGKQTNTHTEANVWLASEANVWWALEKGRISQVNTAGWKQNKTSPDHHLKKWMDGSFLSSKGFIHTHCSP